ncbi:M15 family metallopeptidase [Candidatus Saccharibacteria bacterium]|nr:M15 family metallopeptidase [Candidatus Saccharibacteria bacterium]
MAEPARQLDNDSIYDEEGNAPSDPRPDLKVLESGGESSEPKSKHLKSVDKDESSNQGLAKAEKTAGRNEEFSEPEEPSFYKKPQKQRGRFGLGGRLTKKNVLIGGGTIGGIAGIVIAIFFALIPLKIEHIVKNLQNRFYATSENAIQNETQNLLTRYMVRHVLPNYKSCGTTTSRNCSVNITGTNPVSNMYRSWANNRIENKLADKYGLEFQRRADGWYIKSPAIGGNGDNIGPNGEKLESEFQRTDRRALRQSVSSAMQTETKWKQVYYRFKVGRLLEEKYGIKRCIIFCAVTDPLADNIAEQKRAAKLFLAQRVLTPRNQTLGIAIQCLLTNCAADVTAETDAVPGENAALAGAPENPETDTAIREGLVKLASTYGFTDIEALVSAYKAMSEKGFQSYLIERALTPVIGKSTAGGLADKIPIFGWIDLTARLVKASHDSSHNLKKLSYVTNASAAVGLFSMYRTYADEIHSGHVTAAEVGSLVNSLGPGDSGSSTDPIVGGTVGAESTPLYSNLIDNKSATTPRSSASLFSALAPKALAATTTTTSTSNTYECNNNQAVQAGQLVCSEEVLGQGNKYADLVKEFLDMPGINVLVQISDLWLKIVGPIFDLANSILGSAMQAVIKPLNLACNLPFGIGNLLPPSSYYCEAKDLATKYAPVVMEGLTKWLIPNPFSSNMSGGRTFDMMAAGADVAGNDSAHTTLGGQKITPQQTADLINQKFEDDSQQFAQKSMFARIFSTDSQYSAVSRLAMEVPLNFKSSVRTSAASFISNPVSGLGNVFGSLFSNKAFAAATAQADPFNVVQYGYPAGTIPSDSETYWDEHCSTNAAQAYQNDTDYQASSWNKAAESNLDPNTQMPVNSSVNPCLLIMAVTGSDGAIYDSSLLTPDDLAGNAAISQNQNTTSTAGATIDLAQLYNNSTNVACAIGTKDLGLQNGYTDGKLVKIRTCAVSNLPSGGEESIPGSTYYVNGANGYAVVNSRVSGAVYAMVQVAAKDKVTLTAISSFRTMAHQQALCAANSACSSGDYTFVAKPGTSNHQMGLAIDFGGLPSTPGPVPGNTIWTWLSQNATLFGYKNYPAEAWHWSPTGN